MRNYGICLLLFFVLAAACFSVGYAVTRTESVRESAVPATEYETETVDELPCGQGQLLMPRRIQRKRNITAWWRSLVI